MRVWLNMIATMTLGVVLAGQRAQAMESPPDPCSLLTAAQVSSTLGDKYGAPGTSVAPRPFANSVQGTDCQYKTMSGQNQVLFRVYFDTSAAQATELHARLRRFFGRDNTSAIVGDEIRRQK